MEWWEISPVLTVMGSLVAVIASVWILAKLAKIAISLLVIVLVTLVVLLCIEGEESVSERILRTPEAMEKIPSLLGDEPEP